MDRRTVAGLVIAAVVLSSALGWIAGSRISSPAEEAARTAAPDPSPILVPAEIRVLSTDVVTRGSGRFGTPQQLVIAPTALKPATGVVARVPLPGAELVEGDVALTASNRPVFLLLGEQPMFRDLGPGLEGQDVLQLEDALIRLGFDPGAADGLYDDATEEAVAAWYDATGYEPFETTEDQLAAVRAAEANLLGARLDILAAQDLAASAQQAVAAARASRDIHSAMAQSSSALVAAAREEAEATNAAATADVSAKAKILDTLLGVIPPNPPTAAELAQAQADVLTAQANIETTRLAAIQAVTEAQATVAGGPAALAAAQAEATAANLAAAADVAAKQAALDALLADPLADPNDVAIAQAELAAAQANASAVQLAGAQATAQAQAAVNGGAALLSAAQAQAAAANAAAAAELAAKQAVLEALTSGEPVPPTPAELAVAQADLAAARANEASVRAVGQRLVSDALVSAATASAEITAADVAIATGNTAVALAGEAIGARQELAELLSVDVELAKRREGIQVPADEIIFVTAAPVRVAEVTASRGGELAGLVMTTTDAVLVVDGSLPLESARLVEAGMTVEIDEPDLGISGTGVVQQVADTPGTNGVDGFHVYFVVSVGEASSGLVGSSVRLTIPIESSGGAVLSVPISAVTLAADGTSRVQRHVDGVFEFVVVEPGISADGYVEVRPIEGTLREGDLVLVGYEQPATVSNA